MQRRRIITARFQDKDEFLQNFYRRGTRGALLVESHGRMELAEQVQVVVEFPRDKRSYRLQGKVVARHTGCRNPPSPSKLEVEFPEEEDPKLQLILDHAHGKEVAFRAREGSRLSCSFEVSYRRDQDFVQEFAEDISEGGTFICSDDLCPVGSEVECRLKPPGYLLGIRLRGKVVWVKNKGKPKGMGVKFLFESDRQRRKLGELIQKLHDAQGPAVKSPMQRIAEKIGLR